MLYFPTTIPVPERIWAIFAIIYKEDQRKTHFYNRSSASLEIQWFSICQRVLCALDSLE